MEKNNYNTDELKQGAKDTYNEAKEALKNIDLKSEAKVTESFLKEFLNNPYNGVVLAAQAKNANLNLALMLIGIWTVSVAVAQLISFFRFTWVNFWSVFQAALAPLVSVVVLSIIITIINKNKSKSLTEILTVVIITRIPMIVASVISILNVLSTETVRLTNPIATFAHGLSVILLYIAMRTMTSEQEDKSFMTFVIMYGLFFVVRFVISFLGIWI